MGRLTIISKLPSLINSRRFQAVTFGILLVIFQEGLGLDEATATKIVALISAWVVGDSLNKTE